MMFLLLRVKMLLLYNMRVVDMNVVRYSVNLFLLQPRITIRKFERYLQPGRTSVASWLGNTVIGKDVPILFFKKTVDGSSSIMIG